MTTSKEHLEIYHQMNKLKNLIAFWNPTCWEEWKKMLNSLSLLCNKLSLMLRWPTSKRLYTKLFMRKIKICWPKVSHQVTLTTPTSTTWRFSWENAAIIPSWSKSWSMICWKIVRLMIKNLRICWMPVERWSWLRSYLKNAKIKEKRSWFFHNSPTCYILLKISWNGKTTNTKELMARSRQRKDKQPLTDTIILTKKEMSSCCQQKLVEWVST